MRVAMYYNNRDVRLENIGQPAPGKGEILVRVMASGICGSDVMEWYRIKKAPAVLGHEIAGDVAGVGDGVRNFRKGDRVFVTHHVPCNDCHYCRTGRETCCETLRTTKFHPGGFSEFVRIPEINVANGTLKLPKEISYEEGSFVEPLGCVVRGQRVAGVKSGDVVLVLGSGISGILHIQLAKARGCSVIATDINDYRLKMAKKFGAEHVLNPKEATPEKIKSIAGKLPDKVIVSTGAVPAVRQAFQLVGLGGTILFFAPTEPGIEIPMPLESLWSRCASIVTSYAAAGKDLEEALKLIKERKVNVKGMITHRLPLSKTGEGFRLTAEGKNSLKIIIEPQK